MNQSRTAEDPIVSEIVRRLVKAYHPDRIYLFGSAARGEAGPDSDYDFMILIPDSAPRELLRSMRAYECLRGLLVPKDVLISTVSDFERQLHLKASLPSTIVREGKLLYGLRPGSGGEHPSLAGKS